jgi:predicted Zn-dependent protease
MRETWEGQHLSAVAPEGVAVSVTIGRESLRLERPGVWPMQWSYRSLRLTQGRLAGEPVRLELEGTDEALVVPDRAFLDAVRRLAPGAALTRSAMAAAPAPEASSGRPSRTGLWVGGTIGAVVAAYFWVLPALAGLLALRVPLQWEVDIGNAVAEELAPPDSVCNDPRVTSTVEGIVALLAESLPDSRYDYRVSVVNDTLVNAFAAPGGQIFVMRGLLQESATPEELAGVLAHEMQHVELRHGTRALLRALPLQAAMSVMGGGAGSTALVGTLGALRYARGDESEADAEGMRLLLAAGVDPQGLISFFQTLGERAEEVPAALTYFSTHPATEERRARLMELSSAAANLPRPISLPAEWSDIRASCRI